MTRTAKFSDGTMMEIEIPEGSDLLERVRVYIGRETVAEITDFDIGLFITRATTQAMTKHLAQTDEA